MGLGELGARGGPAAAGAWLPGRRLEPHAEGARGRHQLCRARRAARLPASRRHPGLPAAADRRDAGHPGCRDLRRPAARRGADQRRARRPSGRGRTCWQRSIPATSPAPRWTSSSDEPLPPDNPLWQHPKVLITPHIASYSVPGDRGRRRGRQHPPRAGRPAAQPPGRPRARLLAGSQGSTPLGPVALQACEGMCGWPPAQGAVGIGWSIACGHGSGLSMRSWHDRGPGGLRGPGPLSAGSGSGENFAHAFADDHAGRHRVAGGDARA